MAFHDSCPSNKYHAGVGEYLDVAQVHKVARCCQGQSSFGVLPYVEHGSGFQIEKQVHLNRIAGVAAIIDWEAIILSNVDQGCSRFAH